MITLLWLINCLFFLHFLAVYAHSPKIVNTIITKEQPQIFYFPGYFMKKFKHRKAERIL